MTLFSAPDYPMFSAPGDERYRNKAAVVHLSVPDYATPEVHTFEAVLPRPQVILAAFMCEHKHCQESQCASRFTVGCC